MTDWNCDRWERLEEIAQSVAPYETLSLLVGDRIIEARITGTWPDSFGRVVTSKQAKQDGWIPVSEGLPASDVWCLVVCNGIVQRQCAQLVVEHDPSAERVWVWQDWEADTCPQNGLSHWRPLPDPPTQKRDYPTWADGYQVNMLTPE